eukprot:2858542-Lingulodinium_polyedra.AAC.1
MEFSSPWVGRTVFIDSDTLEASESEAAESAESSEADSIVSLDFISVTPKSPASSDTESIAVDRPRGRFGSASADEGAPGGAGKDSD